MGSHRCYSKKKGGSEAADLDPRAGIGGGVAVAKPWWRKEGEKGTKLWHKERRSRSCRLGLTLTRPVFILSWPGLFLRGLVTGRR
jgi:hypothetical protein